jgi:hypothetical protein
MSQNKEAGITLKEIKVRAREDKQKEHVIMKCPEEKPTSFKFKYNERWAKEDTRHFHNILRKNKLDLPLEKYKDRQSIVQAFDELKDKRKNVMKAKGMAQEVLDKETTMDEDNTVDQFIYNDVRPKYVKVLQRKPYKIKWSDRRFCQYETIPARKIDELARQGIDVNQLRNRKSDQYYDLVVRCPANGRFQYEGKYYCQNHFRDRKYGRPKTEDLAD